MPESTLGVGRPGDDGDVGNMTDACQCLATETVRCHGSKVVIATDLARRETLADYLHVFTLKKNKRESIRYKQANNIYSAKMKN